MDIESSSVAKTVYLLFLVTGITGVLSYGEYNFLPVPVVLDAVVIVIGLVSSLKMRRSSCLVILISVAYLSVGMFRFVYLNGGGSLDLFLGYKSIVYVAILSALIGKSYFSREDLKKILNLLLVVFFVKYSYSRILQLDPLQGSRPGVFAENNFELIFLSIVFYITNSRAYRQGFIAWACFATITVMSASRSAALAFIVVLIFSVRWKISIKSILYAMLVMASALTITWIFAQRMGDGGVEDVDRYKFALVFLSEIRDWNFSNYLFGNMPFRALSGNSCQSLSFYKELFSYTGDGSCYSVIFHAFVIRTIFDHGVIGLLAILFFIWFSMIESGNCRRDAFCIVVVALVSGLSVSSFGSAFFAMAMTIAITSQGANRVKQQYKGQ